MVVREEVKKDKMREPCVGLIDIPEGNRDLEESEWSVLYH